MGSSASRAATLKIALDNTPMAQTLIPDDQHRWRLLCRLSLTALKKTPIPRILVDRDERLLSEICLLGAKHQWVTQVKEVSWLCDYVNQTLSISFYT